MLGVKHGPVVPAVILDLQGVGADQDPGGANEGAEGPLVPLQHLVIPNLGIEILGCIAGHDQQHGDLLFVIASELGFVSQRLEDQPLEQRPETGGHIAQVIGRADDQTVHVPDGIQYRSQAILADADCQKDSPGIFCTELQYFPAGLQTYTRLDEITDACIML